jgi:hypothetical protein
MPATAGQRTSPGVRKAAVKAVTDAERQRDAIELRKAGHTFQEIADRLGYRHASGAHQAVMAGLRKIVQEPADELRRMELERLDVMLKSAWPFILKGSPRHIEVGLKVMDRRAALLGLDAPKQVEDHRTVTIAILAERLASETGLDTGEIVAEAERIIAETGV